MPTKPPASLIHKRLERLYGTNDANEAYKKWGELIDFYSSKIAPKPHSPDQRDSILICYANSFNSKENMPLQSLKIFLDSHLKGLFHGVHILPFFPYSSDDGFSVIDYKEVDQGFGNWDDIEALQEHFHLMVDGVINHMSCHSKWFKKYLANEEGYEDFFISLPPDVDLSTVVRPRTSPLLTPFEDIDGKTRFIWTTFSADQVDLNFGSWRVLLAMLDALLFYVQKGATLVRLDAIAFVWKELGSPCVHLPQTHEIIQFLRESIHCVDPNVRIITETNVPHAENISYFGKGDDEAQMVYNFALPPLIAYAVITEHAHHLHFWAHGLKLPSDKVCFFNFTASHDGIGLRPVQEILTHEEINQLLLTCKARGGEVSYRSYEGKKEPYELNCTYFDLVSSMDMSIQVQVERFLLSQAIMLCMPGVPGVYYSSLFGAQNDKKGFARTNAPRSLNREKFNLNSIQRALSNTQSKESLVFKGYQKLLTIRHNHKAFNPFGDFTCISLHPQVFAILRHFENESILCLNNLSMDRVNFELPPKFTNSLDLLQETVHEGAYITLEGSQVAWLKLV